MANALQLITGSVYFIRTGEVRDAQGLNNFNAGSNVNRLLVYIEDGDGTNLSTINYSPIGKIQNWASHDFPLFFRGMVQHTISGEQHPRTFAEYATLIPPQILALNINGTSPMTVGVTVKQTAGFSLLGGFPTYLDLVGQYPPSEQLRDNNSIAYVWENGQDGYYMVEYNVGSSLYEWKLNQDGRYLNHIYSKADNMVNITIQRSGNNPIPIEKISNTELKMIWQEMNIINSLIESLDIQLIDNIFVENTPSISSEVTKIGKDYNIKLDVIVDESEDNLLTTTPLGLFVSQDSVVETIRDDINIGGDVKDAIESGSFNFTNELKYKGSDVINEDSLYDFIDIEDTTW